MQQPGVNGKYGAEMPHFPENLNRMEVKKMPCYEPKWTLKEWIINGAFTFVTVIGFAAMFIIFN